MAIDNILVVGKDLGLHQLAQEFTRKLYAADEVNDVWPLIDSVKPDLILFDSNLPHDPIHAILKPMQQKKIDIPVVVVCPKEHKEHTQKLLHFGAFDYIYHDDNSKRLGQVIEKIKNPKVQSDSQYFVSDCPPSLPIVGKSTAIKKAMSMIRMVAHSTCNPVLIVGETGTGKELAARAVHAHRYGSHQHFIAVNCAALTANLLESELFGHVKGSFTSADREKTGLLEIAENGTIFLDEISEMPMDLQAKLLRVLQEKTFRKVGGTEEIQCNATIIASSNRNLLKEVEKNRFRRDLYYRLSICPIILAPLRSSERAEDILLLADYFIQNSSICPDKKGKIKGITKLGAEMLLRHDWPGNIRELRNVIERAVLLEQSDRIGTVNLMLYPDCFDDTTDTKSSISSEIENDFSLERAEKELVSKALHETGWQKTRAAALLGITRATLYAKLKQYNIQHPTDFVDGEVESEAILV